MHVSHEEFMKIWRVKPMTSADAVLIKDGKVLLVRRATEPFLGHWAIPGGFMETDETIEETAIRELREETGIEAKPIKLIGVYSGPGRDPRGTSLAVAFLMKYVKDTGKKDNETSESKFFGEKELPKLAFDHARILKDAYKEWHSMKK